MGKEWIRTPEQEAYLDGEFKGYLKARKDGEVKTWRTRLHEKWEERWPERQALINEWNLANDSLFNPAQMAVLGEALAARKTQLYNYIRWRTDAKPVRAKNSQTLLARYLRKVTSAKKGPKKSKRKRAILEIYSDRYYKGKIQSLVNQELDDDPEYASLPQKKKKAHQLSVYRRIRADCWKTESDEVKGEIQEIFDEEHEVKSNGSESEEDEDNDDDNNDDDNDEKNLLRHQQESIDNIGSVVTAFLQDCREATGFAWQLVGGGLDKLGEIKVVMCTVGKTMDGRKFQDTHPNWQPGLVYPWYEFLQQRHPIEERHRRASLWAQPSVSETDTPNLAPVPSTQPQNSPLNPSVANVNPSPIASSQCQATTTDTPNLAPVPTSSPQPQNSPADPLIANVNPSTIASSQYQATTTDIPNLAPVPTSRRPVSSPQPQNSPADPLIANVSISPVTSSQRQATTTVVTGLEFQTTPSTLSIANVNPSPITSSQYQATTTDIPNLAPVLTSSPQPQNSPADSLIANVNLSPVTSSQRQATTTAVTSLQFQTTPSTLTSPQSTSAFYYHPTMLQSGVEFPKPNSPLTEFLESTSPSGLYAWDNNMSTSSNSFDFSGMNSPQQLTLDAGPIFGMDQYWNSPQASLFSTMAPTPMLNTMATPLHPDLEVSVHQNIPMSIATTDFILPNYATPQNNLTPSNSIPPNCAAPRNNLTSATNHLILPNSAVMDTMPTDGDDKSKKRKSYEEQNAHCILPEGSRRARKGRRIEGAEDENAAGLTVKKRNAKEKRSRGKK